MKNLPISSKKYFVANNVVILRLGDQLDADKYERLFKMLREDGVVFRGPRILWCKTVVEDNLLVIQKFAVLNCNKTPSFDHPDIRFEEKLRIGPCIYSKIKCMPNQTPVVYNKISVFAFENDIKLKDETISVYLKESDTEIEMDAFVPIDVK